METEATSLRGNVGSVTVAAEKPQARRCPRVIRSRVSVSVCVLARGEFGGVKKWGWSGPGDCGGWRGGGS